jgi:hypothetical protein
VNLLCSHTPLPAPAATAIDRVVQFFKTPAQLDFSNLSAQATSQVGWVGRNATQPLLRGCHGFAAASSAAL